MTTSIKTINRRTRLAVAAVPLLVGMAVLTGPAQAATPVQADHAGAMAASSNGSCSSKGAYINFSAFYHNSSRHHVFTSYAWTIGGNGVRKKNNVEVRVKHDNRLGHDPIYWTWISKDNVRKGRSSISRTVRVPKKQRAYVEFKAVFDKKGSDPRCTGHTRNI
jgi:hypothetical protein